MRYHYRYSDRRSFGIDACYRPFDGFVAYSKCVTPACLVHLERNRYSVPASFANRPLSLQVYLDRVVIAAEAQIVCQHRRVIDRSHDRPRQTIYDCERKGNKKWRKRVFDVVEVLIAALEPDYVVIGGGNVEKLDKLPPKCRRGDNSRAFDGGFRLWRDKSLIV